MLKPNFPTLSDLVSSLARKLGPLFAAGLVLLTMSCGLTVEEGLEESESTPSLLENDAARSNSDTEKSNEAETQGDDSSTTKKTTLKPGRAITQNPQSN